MWIIDYYNELKAWSIIRRVYKDNKDEFDKVGLKSDWFGRLWKVINRDANISLGSKEDEELLMKEMNEIRDVLVRTNVIDILAYELIPLELVDESDDTFENSYLMVFTPAWNLNKQYVTIKSTILLLISLFCIIGAVVGVVGSIIYSITNG